jgi:hypothetical protein
LRARGIRAILAILPLLVVLAEPAQASGASGAIDGAGKGFPMHMKLERTVNIGKMTSQPKAGAPSRQQKLVRRPEFNRRRDLDSKAATPFVSLGGANAPPSSVATPSTSNSQGFDGINITRMESAGTGNYQGSNGGLEPPDQALCVGNGFLVEGVNTAYQVFTYNGNPLTPPIPIVQVFGMPPHTSGASAFVSDPRCMYDPATNRFFLITLEIDEVSGTSQLPFTRAHNFVAVSKTGDPTGDFYIYSFDVTDDGQNGTPMHPGCLIPSQGGPSGCLGDQPLMGADPNGFYLSTNEYTYAELLPVQLPPAAGGIFNTPFTLPDMRNGQAQLYAYSKAQLIGGAASVNGETWDTASVPLPEGAPQGALWSSLQPSHSPPGDSSPSVKNGTEFFLSSMDFDTTGSNKIAVWALTNSASLNSSPNLTLKHRVINTNNVGDTYQAKPPSGPFAADQKDGPHPLADSCQPVGCALEQLNANDDRMNEVMRTNGVLYGGVNTVLPQINPQGTGTDLDYRVGIMYFEVAPYFDGDSLFASMLRDGYVNVPRENVLFPSIGTTPAGDVIMGFTLSGVDNYPSAAWTRLANAPTLEFPSTGPSIASAGPTVYVSGPGVAPEDGFTGYCSQGLVSDPLHQCSNGVARWGDYSYTEVDENGCVWSATEYIPNDARDPFGGDWGSFVTRIKSGRQCNEPDIPSPTVRLHINPCMPLWSDPTADDELNGLIAPVPATQGQNPQLDIVQGDITFSPDGKYLSTILTIRDLSTTLPPGGQANNYYFYWTFGNTKYITLASVDATGTPTYSDGSYVGGFRTFRTGAPADTGQFIPGPGGKVIVTVPVSVIGNPHKGELLLSPNGETREVEGPFVLGYDDDTTVQSYDYLVGAVCAASNNQPVAVSTATLGIPNSSAGLVRVQLLPLLLVVTGLALGAGLMLLRRGGRPA